MDARASRGCLTAIPWLWCIRYSFVVEMDVRGINKFMEGLKMAISATVESKRNELVVSARLWGGNLSRQAFGEQGPDLNVTMADLEICLRPVVEALAEGFLSVAAEQQTGRLAETLPCPSCGRACPKSHRERTLKGEHGPFTWGEPVCYCDDCERSFFPSANRAQD